MTNRASLHWLTIHTRSDFKVLWLTSSSSSFHSGSPLMDLGAPGTISLSRLLLPHILMHMDHHNMGSAGSLLYSVLVSRHICKMWCLFTLIFFVILLIISCGLPPPRHHGREEVVWVGHRCLGLLSRLLDPQTVRILEFVSDTLSMQLVNCDFVALFCTYGISRTSARPGRGIPPLWLFLSFLLSLF